MVVEEGLTIKDEELKKTKSEGRFGSAGKISETPNLQPKAQTEEIKSDMKKPGFVMATPTTENRKIEQIIDQIKLPRLGRSNSSFIPRTEKQEYKIPSN